MAVFRRIICEQQLNDPIARNNMVIVIILSSWLQLMTPPDRRNWLENPTEGTGPSGLRDPSTSAGDAVRSRGATLTGDRNRPQNFWHSH